MISEISEGNMSGWDRILGESQFRLLVRKLYNLLKKRCGRERSRKLAVQLVEKQKETE